MCVYLLPVRLQARGLSALWRRRAALRAVAWSLAAVHAVPLSEHLPRFVGALTWGDGWRGIGAAVAVAWFLAPVSIQAAVIGALARAAGIGRVALPPARPSAA